MGTVYVDAAIGDDLRRERLFSGELFAYSPNAGSAALVGSRAGCPRTHSHRTTRQSRRTR